MIVVLCCLPSTAVGQNFPLEIQGIWKITEIEMEIRRNTGSVDEGIETPTTKAFCILADRFIEVNDYRSPQSIKHSLAAIHEKWYWVSGDQHVFIFLKPTQKDHVRYRAIVEKIDVNHVKVIIHQILGSGITLDREFKLERFEEKDAKKVVDDFRSNQIRRKLNGDWIYGSEFPIGPFKPLINPSPN